MDDFLVAGCDDDPVFSAAVEAEKNISMGNVE